MVGPGLRAEQYVQNSGCPGAARRVLLAGAVPIMRRPEGVLCVWVGFVRPKVVQPQRLVSFCGSGVGRSAVHAYTQGIDKAFGSLAQGDAVLLQRPASSTPASVTSLFVRWVARELLVPGGLHACYMSIAGRCSVFRQDVWKHGAG